MKVTINILTHITLDIKGKATINVLIYFYFKI